MKKRFRVTNLVILLLSYAFFTGGYDLIAKASSVTVEVPGTAGLLPPPDSWVDSGISLLTGDTVSMTATGSVSWDMGYNWAGPDGDPSWPSSWGFDNPVLPGAPVAALIAKIGDGPIFFVGSGPSSASGEGELIFAVNDQTGAHYNNIGSFFVTITFEEPPPPMEKHDVAVTAVSLLKIGTSQWFNNYSEYVRVVGSWKDAGNSVAIFKQGQVVPLEITVENKGDFDENVEVFFSTTWSTELYIGPTKTVTLPIGGSETIILGWDTKQDKPSSGHEYQIWAAAQLPQGVIDANLANNILLLNYHVRIEKVLPKDWSIIPEHANTPSSILWEFPDNFEADWSKGKEDGSAAHNHRRSMPFYAFAIWDNRNATGGRGPEEPEYYYNGNMNDTDFERAYVPWLFYYSHGFISQETPLRYYFYNKTETWPLWALESVEAAFEAWSQLQDTSNPQLVTGINFEHNEALSFKEAEDFSGAEIVIYWGGYRTEEDRQAKTWFEWASVDGQQKRICKVAFPARDPWPYQPFYEFFALHELGHVLGLTHGVDIKPVREGRERALDLYSIPAWCSMYVEIGSPALLYITDPVGRNVGFDPATNDIVNNVPYAKLSESGYDPENITVPWPVDGTYKIRLVGTEDGPYTLNVTLFTDFSTHTTQTFTGTITKGAIFEYSLDISDQIAVAKPNPAGDSNQLSTFINNLPSNVFNLKISSANRMKKALTNKINEIIAKVEAGNYSEAIDKLLCDIRKKMDGDSTAQDWIIEPTTQYRLCLIIDHIIQSTQILQEDG